MKGFFLLSLLSVAWAVNLFSIDATKKVADWDHYWEECVGSGHATLALRADWQAHIKQVHQELGFKSVRFHGLFDDDMSVYLGYTDGNLYSFFNIDQIYDYLVSIGMKPYVEISFMPELLASGNKTIMHYKGNTSPPKNYDDWASLVYNFASHIVDRYGIDEISKWKFEVWNEPNLDFWSGNPKQSTYWTLYNYTAFALKAVHPEIKVGGPATASSSWIPEFVDYMTSNKIPFDFVSTHEYPTDHDPLTRGWLKTIVTQTRSQVPSQYPLIYSEYNDGLGSNPPFHDTPYASAFIIKNVYDINGLLDTFSWWTFSDIFEEPGFLSSPFGEPSQWGLLNIHQIPKPSYRAFQLLHQSGDTLVQVDPLPEYYPTVGVYAIRGGNQLMIFSFNHDVPQNSITAQDLNITVTGVSSSSGYGTFYQVDDDHCNVAQAWRDMGAPKYLKKDQIDHLMKVSQLTPTKLRYTVVDQRTVQFTYTLPPYGIGVIALDI